jgi:thiamine-phosphate pyrophosphorylase
VIDARAAARAGLVEAVVSGGVDWLQLRDRTLEGAGLFALLDAVCAAARRAGADRPAPVRVVVSRRMDAALATGADGVHLPFDGVDAADARVLLGGDALVGISAHAPEEIDARGGASYAHLAPIHPPLSKPPERPPLGLAAITRAAARGLPVLAQGGIEARNARAAIAAGAAGVAVTGSILNAPDPRAAARALREALDAAV